MHYFLEKLKNKKNMHPPLTLHRHPMCAEVSFIAFNWFYFVGFGGAFDIWCFCKHSLRKDWLKGCIWKCFSQLQKGVFGCLFCIVWLVLDRSAFLYKSFFLQNAFFVSTLKFGSQFSNFIFLILIKRCFYVGIVLHCFAFLRKDVKDF